MLSEYIDEEVRFIKKQFLCCVPIKNISWNNFFTCPTWDRQGTLIANTVDLDIVKKYPIKLNYQVAFLKYLIDRLERLEDTDINDCVYDALGRLVSLVDAGKCYKHYYFNFKGKNRIITLEENLSIISEGTTGLCSWQASLALSEWCLRNSELFKNKTILELGAGVGLTGLVIALNYFETNRNSEISAFDSLLKVDTESFSVSVINLPWENVKTQIDKFKDIDLVLAADVVYDSSLFECLSDALKCFLSNGQCQKVYLACTERNRKTLWEFLEQLEDRNLLYEELLLPEQGYFHWSTEVPIRLFCIEKGSFN
ncbi:hypothetical protein Trydic_g18139 [Trypoxylus dichotomus]